MDEDSESVATDYLDSPRSGQIPPGLNNEIIIIDIVIMDTKQRGALIVITLQHELHGFDMVNETR